MVSIRIHQFELVKTVNNIFMRIPLIWPLLFAARIYTVYVDSADTMLLANFTISFILSAAVYLAAFYYKKHKKIIIR